MPKSKKPAGGRPAKNFEPRYGAKKSAAAPGGRPSTPGSRSPKHRGFRVEEPAAPGKSRWTNEDRDARGERESRRGVAGDRPARSGYSRDDRTDRPRYDRDARPARSNDRGNDRSDRFSRDDRPARSSDRFERSDRPRYDRDDRRPARTPHSNASESANAS